MGINKITMSNNKKRSIFNKKYMILSIILLGIEVIIAIFFKGNFVRTLLGDYLVVILMYCVVKSFTDFNYIKTAISVLFFAYFIEFLQYINILKIIGIKRTSGIGLTFGSIFDWNDIFAYTMGVLTILVVEYYLKKIKGS